jgi:hypothetical protein
MMADFNSPEELLKAYNDGLPGWRFDAADKDNLNGLFAETPDRFLSEAAPHLVGSGAGKRATLWRSREIYDPGAYGQERQTTGDCVSHGSRNARDTTRCVEQHIKGEPLEYFKRGATEPTYGSRGSGGQGMDPGAAARFERDFGYMVRQNYPGVVDLSTYNGNTGAGWGGRGLPAAVRELCKQRKVGSFINPRTAEDAMDLLQNGYAIHSGQNVGFSSTPGADGIFRRGSPWGHDMATTGYDDSKAFYPVRVWFVQNSWAAWCTPPAKWPVDLYGPYITGMIVCSDDDYHTFWSAGSMFAYQNVQGFPRQNLPDYGVPSNILG